MTNELATQVQAAIGSDYHLERELGGGGMSRVFLATDSRHDRHVVIKVLASDFVSPETTERFKREIAWTIKLQHPNILPILTSGGFGECLYYVAPFITGESLRTRIKREGKLPLEDIIRILRDVSDALAFAHAEGVVHRDVKPGNILLAGSHAILADFGIARAVDPRGTPLTASGLMPGTPAYMSPELPTDQSADVFALGVVAYEMLCGELPARDVTVVGILAARAGLSDDSKASLARLGELVTDTIGRPASGDARVTTAQAFLAAVEGTHVGRSRRLIDPIRLAIAGGVAVALLAGWAFVARPTSAKVNRDMMLVALATEDDAQSQSFVRHVEDALGEWRGITIVSVPPTSKATATRDVKALAREAAAAGAGSALAVSIRSQADSVDVHILMYDVQSGAATRRGDGRFARASWDASAVMTMRRLVNRLVRDGEELPWREASDQSAQSLSAWRSYDAGRLALAKWSLSDAVTALQAATLEDPTLAVAQLWLAQALQWADTTRVDEARSATMRAMSGQQSLTSRDSALASGLAALTAENYESARLTFEMLTKSQPTFFATWLDAAETELRDPVVVRNPRSPTGWAFRGNFEYAARAYRQAALSADARTGPAFHGWILGRLANVLYGTPNHVRRGYFIDRDTVFMGAFPYLDTDSEAFAPHPLADFKTRKGDPPRVQVQASVDRSLRILRTSAENWVRLAPSDPAAFDSLANLSEVSGGTAVVGGRSYTTLELLHMARSFSTDSIEQARLASAETRLLVKNGRFAEARDKADSLLRTRPVSRFREIPGIVGLTTLVGRPRDAVALKPLTVAEHRVVLPDGSVWTLPRAVGELTATLEAFSVFGIFADSIPTLATRLCDLIGDYVPDATRANQIRSVLVASTFGYGDPTTANVPGCALQAPDELIRAVLLLSAGDVAAARSQMNRLREIDRGKGPGNGIRFAYRSARVWLALGDTAIAMHDLDEIVRTLPTLDPTLFDDFLNIGSLVRVYALRAQLARHDDPGRAAMDAAVVLTLWRRGDSVLRPLVDSMQSIVAARR